MPKKTFRQKRGSKRASKKRASQRGGGVDEREAIKNRIRFNKLKGEYPRNKRDTHADETPAGQTHVSNTPAGQTHVSNTPADETHVSNTPVDEHPVITRHKIAMDAIYKKADIKEQINELLKKSKSDGFPKMGKEFLSNNRQYLNYDQIFDIENPIQNNIASKKRVAIFNNQIRNDIKRDEQKYQERVNAWNHEPYNGR
jgi:hypothetical protein